VFTVRLCPKTIFGTEAEVESSHVKFLRMPRFPHHAPSCPRRRVNCWYKFALKQPKIIAAARAEVIAEQRRIHGKVLVARYGDSVQWCVLNATP
jgi:hypothetical protein